MGSLNRVRTAAVLLVGVGVLIGATVTAWHLLTREPERGTTVGTTWDYYEPSGKVVTIHALIGGCDDVDDVLVEEDEASVTITMVVDSGGLFCGMVATDVATRVRLERPLGDRAVYDGSCVARGHPAAECVRTPQPRQGTDHPEDVAVLPRLSPYSGAAPFAARAVRADSAVASSSLATSLGLSTSLSTTKVGKPL